MVVTVTQHNNFISKNLVVSKVIPLSLDNGIIIYYQPRGSLKGHFGQVRLHKELCFLLQCVLGSNLFGLCCEPLYFFWLLGIMPWAAEVSAGSGEETLWIHFPMPWEVEEGKL